MLSLVHFQGQVVIRPCCDPSEVSDEDLRMERNGRENRVLVAEMCIVCDGSLNRTLV